MLKNIRITEQAFLRMGEADGGHWPTGKGEGASKQFQPKKYKDSGQEWRRERKEVCH